MGSNIGVDNHSHATHPREKTKKLAPAKLGATSDALAAVDPPAKSVTFFLGGVYWKTQLIFNQKVKV